MTLTIGDWLRARRESEGLGLREVAARARLDAGYLSRVERGQKQLGAAHFGRLAKALRCSVRDLRLADEFTPCRHCGRTGPRGKP